MTLEEMPLGSATGLAKTMEIAAETATKKVVSFIMKLLLVSPVFVVLVLGRLSRIESGFELVESERVWKIRDFKCGRAGILCRGERQAFARWSLIGREW